MKQIAATIEEYNLTQTTADRAICELLQSEIAKSLKNSTSKIWHGAPVWFLGGNPIVGYSKQKAGIKLMFWSGADFEEVSLNIKGGKFKDAAIMYTNLSEINLQELRQWLKKAIKIQWNYKDIVKNKGKLSRLQTKKAVPTKECIVVDGVTIKYHASGKTIWSKGKMKDGKPDGYWEWYRPDGTLKRSGHFKSGEPVGEWTTYDGAGKVYKITHK